MALVVDKSQLPGYKTFKQIYDLIPGGGTVKKIIVGVTIGAIIVGAIAAGAVGIAALVTAVSGSILGSTLLTAGIIAALPFVFNAIANVVRTLYTFNWNMTDSEIDGTLKSSLASLYGMLGEVAGTAVGWLICGILPATVTFAFNPVIAKEIMKDMTEEAQEEVWGALASCQQSAVALLGRAVLLKGFKSARRWLKKPGTPQYNYLKKTLGENFTKWGEEGSKSFSFSQYVEDRIEEIPDENWRNFTEEFVDSLLDSCSEALQNLGNSMRTQMSAYYMMRKREAQAQSEQMVVQLDFSRDDDEPAPATT